MQLPPTRRIAFPSALMYQADSQYPDPHSPSNNMCELKNPFDTIGCDLFSLFTRFHLTKQHRAEGDIEHFQFVKKLSTGEQINIDDDLARYKTLSKEDLSSSKWMYAPYIVSTNMERLQIFCHQASKFAKHNNTYLYRWPLQLHSWKNRPTLDSHREEVSEHPVFWQYFVPGTHAYITNN